MKRSEISVLIGIMCLGIMSSASATDTNMLTDGNHDWTGEEDSVSWDDLSPYSKEALMITYDTENEITALPKSIKDWTELTTYLKSQGIKIETNHISSYQELKSGNHLILNGKPYKFLKTSNNAVFLEDLENTYTITLENFKKSFNGDILNIHGDTTNYNTNYPEKKNINSTEPIITGKSTISKKLLEWNKMDKNPRIKAWAVQITAGTNDPVKKCEKIFKYVQKNIRYDFHYNTKQSPISTYKTRKGNCCEKSMLLTVLCRAAASTIPVQYQFSKDGRLVKSGKQVGHVWNAHFIKGKWLVSDSTCSWCRFAQGNDGYYKKGHIELMHYLRF